MRGWDLAPPRAHGTWEKGTTVREDETAPEHTTMAWEAQGHDVEVAPPIRKTGIENGPVVSIESTVIEPNPEVQCVHLKHVQTEFRIVVRS